MSEKKVQYGKGGVFDTLAPIKYDTNLAGLVELRDKYMPLAITDLNDKEQFDAVHEARMVMVKVRTSIERQRKAQKVSALQYGRDVDAAAGELSDLSDPIEEHLQTEENKVLDEKKRIKDEVEAQFAVMVQARVDTLMKYNVVLPFAEVAEMDDIAFSERLDEAKLIFEQTQKRLAEEEKERIIRQAELDRQQADQDRKDKEQAIKEEALRIDREAFEDAKQAEIDRQLAEQVKRDKKQTDKEEALRKEREKLERDKREAKEKEDRIKFEKETAEKAKIQADQDAKEKIEREMREAKEKEDAAKAETARQEALKPDKEKLIAWAESLASLVSPEVHSPEANVIVENAELAITHIAETITKKGREM